MENFKSKRKLRIFGPDLYAFQSELGGLRGAQPEVLQPKHPGARAGVQNPTSYGRGGGFLP